MLYHYIKKNNIFLIINECLEFSVAYILWRVDASVSSCRRFCYYLEYKKNMRGGGGWTKMLYTQPLFSKNFPRSTTTPRLGPFIC